LINEHPVLADRLGVISRPSFPVSQLRPAILHELDTVVAQMLIAAIRLITCPRARWIGCSPDKKARIYFANHTSHLDFLLLWSVLPPKLRRKARPVAASDYWHSNSVRQHLAERVFRSVFIERQAVDRCLNPIAPLLESLDQSESLILFPEGTRSSGESLRPFRSGIFHLADARPEIELVPVWIDNACRVMPKGSFVPLPLLCTVTFGLPTHLAAHEEKAVFLERLQRELQRMRTL
jgi:1-acyl-sn-glycerol-3-phosphate acyltransferase